MALERLRRLRQDALAGLLMLIYLQGYRCQQIPPKGTCRKRRMVMAAHETHAHTPHAQHDAHQPPQQGVKDPVCGMTVDPHTAKHRHTHNGRPYYFCSAGCRENFVANPTQYLEPEPRIAEPIPAGTIYTCPMHPEIRQPGPGACPICGMALEPELCRQTRGPIRARRYVAAVLDGLGADCAGVRMKWAGTSRTSINGSASRHRTDTALVGDACVLWAGCSSSSGPGLPQESQSQHVHADRNGRVAGLRIVGKPAAGRVSAAMRGHTAPFRYFEAAP